MEQEIYILVGKIIEGVQNIEYLLVDGIKMAKILNVYNKYSKVSLNYYHKIEEDIRVLTEEMENMTFGNIIHLVRTHEVLPSDDIEYLESILSKRNQLVHKYFKYNELNKCTEDIKYKYLSKFYHDTCEFINYLENVIMEMKNDLDKVDFEEGI